MARGMVERVAMELAKHENGAPTTWKLYADNARFAIRAMEKPTQSMLSAASEAARKARTDDYAVIWKAMIGAALAEPT